MSELNLTDYIPDDLKEFYKNIQNLFPVCLKCQKPVFIQNIMDNKVVKVKIDCEYCQNSQSLTIEDYINQLNALVPDKINCAKHAEKKCYGFCKECNNWLCDDCFKKHISDNHTLYLSQFKIRPFCAQHPEEKACFFQRDNGSYSCMKCDFKSKLDKLENNFFNNARDDRIMGHCFRCLYYEFIGNSTNRLILNFTKHAKEFMKDDNEENKKLFGEKIEILTQAKTFLDDSIKKVRESNILIANGFLKNLPNYHTFKNIKNNMGENHTMFWPVDDLKLEYEDYQDNMTKEKLIEFIDQITDICYKHLTTSMHQKLSEENDLDFVDESDILMKEIKCVKFNYERRLLGVKLLSENERFLIYSQVQFIIYDAKTFEQIQETLFTGNLSYIDVLDKNRFIAAIDDHYELYEWQETQYKLGKTVTLEKVEKKPVEKEKKEEKKKKSENDDSDSDSGSNSDKNSDDDINNSIDSIALLKDKTKIAVGQGSLITIREFETGKLIKTLKKHEGGVGILFTLNKPPSLNYLISCCSCNNFCFWDLDTLEFLSCIDAEVLSPNSYLLLNDEFMLTGGFMIPYLIDLKKRTVTQAFSGNFSLLHGFVKLDDLTVIFATKDDGSKTNNFYLYYTFTKEYELQLKNIHNDICEGCISINSKQFISVSRDSTFKVWEINEENL